MHHELLEHGHDDIIIAGEILLDHAGDDGDGSDGLLAQASVLCCLQLRYQLLHVAWRIPCHERVVELLAERNKGRHGHCCNAIATIVHLLQECGHHRLVPILLEVRRLVICQLPNSVERRVAYARMRVVHVLKQELRHLIDVTLLLHVLDGLFHRRQCGMLGLPLLLRGEVADEAEERWSEVFHRHSLHHTVDCLLAGMEQLILILIALFVVHPIHPHLELLFPVFDLQHELHASLKDERCEALEVLREPLHPLLEISH
mmetsp:Transcript_48557/g.110631  ORF Transcript_48557/g.110631 Transcript_48557/m.110631 type:complete len:259 (+) Transcript_48557:1331-2107(+)